MLVIFFPALVIAQIIPKIGFGFALGLMLIVVGTSNASFFPEMIVGLAAVSVYIWKGD